VRQEARRDLLVESHKHHAVELLRQIPAIGPIRAALLVALLQTGAGPGGVAEFFPQCITPSRGRGRVRGLFLGETRDGRFAPC